MQAFLFGDDTPQPATDPAARTTATPINDLDLIGSVVRTATETGYVLIGQGTTARVLLRDAGRKGWAVTVPVYEAAAVLQLLDAGHLRRGGAHHIHHGDHQGPADAVLVPDATRAMARRWAARATRSRVSADDAPALPDCFRWKHPRRRRHCSAPTTPTSIPEDRHGLATPRGLPR